MSSQGSSLGLLVCFQEDKALPRKTLAQDFSILWLPFQQTHMHD